MPAIKQIRRDALDTAINVLAVRLVTPGDIVYAFTRILLAHYADQSFTNRSRALADLEATKLEWYRIMIAPYEDTKYIENGRVFPG